MFKTIHKTFRNHYHKNYHNQYEHAKKLFAFDIFLLSVAIVMFFSTLYFLFWNPGLTDQIDLKISIGNDRVKSGQEVKLTVDYKNHSRYALHNATIALHLPNGFVVNRAKTPTDEFSDQSTFSVQDIKPGAKGQLSVYGYMWVVPKTDETVIALLSYIPENSKYKEQKLGKFLMNLPDSVIQTRLDIATTSFANNIVPFSFVIKNNSDQKLNELDVNFNFPGKINADDFDLHHISLEKNLEKTINGSIVMPTKSGQYNLIAVLNGDFNNSQVKILDTKSTIKTFSPNIEIKAALSGASYVEPKQEITGLISWHNGGQFQLQNQSIRLNFTPGIVDLKATAKENNFKLDNNSLIVNGSARTALSSGAPSTNDQFSFKIILLPTFSLGNTENPSLEIKPTFIGELKDVAGQKFEIHGQSAFIPVATELSLHPSVRYYSDDGDQLGRGPLPPIVGQTTKYWIFVQINNTTNPVKDASLNINLSGSASFTGKQSVTIGPALTHNNGNLSWNYRELPPHSQTGWYFEVAVTPTSEQIGQNINLINSIKFTAKDKITGKDFSLTTKTPLKNVLPNADKGSEKSSSVQ